MTRPLTPHDELAVALRTIDDFGRSIQSADAKAGVLAAVLGLVVGSLANDSAVQHAAWVSTANVSALPGIAFVVFVASLVVAGVLLGLTQVPRLTTPGPACRLSLPSAARVGCRRTRPTATGLRDEAWHQAEVLAAIALRKFQYLRIALIMTGVCVASFLFCLVTSGAIG